MLLLADGEETFAPAALWPDAAAEAALLAPVAERALLDRASVADPAHRNGDSDKPLRLAHPILDRSDLLGVVAIELEPVHAAEIKQVLDQIAWAVAWPQALHWRLRASERPADTGGGGAVVDVLRAADQHDRFGVAAVLVANRVVTNLHCERVSLGLIGRRGIQVVAISNTAAFDRKSELVQSIEAAMQEAFDQHGSVVHPPTRATERRISVAHADFLQKWTGGSIASVLLVAAGHPIGVLALERRSGAAFDDQSLHTAEQIAEGLGPLLYLKHRQERLITGRLFQALGNGLARIFGRERLSWKLGAVALCCAIAFLALWPSAFRVSARAVLEGSIQRAAVAPFDGFVAKAPHRAGDIVKAGQELATLDDRDLLLEKLKWETERQKLIQRQRDAMAKHERTNLLVLSTQIEQAASQLDLVLEKLKRSRISAPIDGIIVSGDLSQMLGAPVAQGKVLFEIAPLAAYRLILKVDERDVGYLAEGQTGFLLLTGASSQPIRLKVTRMTAVASAEDGSNFFRVEASIDEAGKVLRPGMEGIAKVEISENSLLWIWTKPLIDRLRMLMWTWLP